VPSWRIQTRFPDADIIAVDHAAPVLAAGRRAGRLARPVCADAARLPLADSSVGLVFCSLMLAYCPDPTPVLAEVRRVMAYPGLFSFATLGRGSLRELAAAWRAADDHAHVAPFIDMHDLGDLLVHAGFVEPVLDTESIAVTYASLDRLISDLRAVGSVNLSARRNTGLTGRSSAQRLRQSWASTEDATGRVGVTLEIIFGQAWAGEPRRPGSGPGEIEIPLAGIRRRGGATDTI
jgi:malonyl-CoA O-methyltransferase